MAPLLVGEFSCAPINLEYKTLKVNSYTPEMPFRKQLGALKKVASRGAALLLEDEQKLRIVRWKSNCTAECMCLCKWVWCYVCVSTAYVWECVLTVMNELYIRAICYHGSIKQPQITSGNMLLKRASNISCCLVWVHLCVNQRGQVSFSVRVRLAFSNVSVHACILGWLRVFLNGFHSV